MAHSGSIVYQGPDKLILSNFNVVILCRPGGARNYPRSRYFLEELCSHLDMWPLSCIFPIFHLVSLILPVGVLASAGLGIAFTLLCLLLRNLILVLNKNSKV